RTPADEISNVLRADDIKEFRTCRQSELIDVQQQLACYAQSIIDAETAIEVWVVDQTFPTYRGTRLFEINAHDDLKLTCRPITLPDQALCIFHRCFGIVDRARTNRHHQTVILTVENAVQRSTCSGRGLGCLVGAAKLANQMRRG